MNQAADGIMAEAVGLVSNVLWQRRRTPRRDAGRDDPSTGKGQPIRPRLLSGQSTDPARCFLRTTGVMRNSTALLALCLAGCSVVGIQRDIEQPPYEVVASLSDDIEIRQYAERIAVEATVTADDFDDARNAAFRLLFDYISGVNQANAEIAMTVPVETTSASQKIEMTAPVESQIGKTGAVTMRFFLPSRFTPKSAPKPTDDRVRLVLMPEQRFAVLAFSGSRNQQVVSARGEQLRAALEALDLNPEAAARAFFYDPPWTLPWLRRNEVAIEVSAGS